MNNPTTLVMPSKAPMAVARWLLRHRFTVEGEPALLVFRGNPYEWTGAQWVEREWAHVERAIWLSTEDVLYEGNEGPVRYYPDISKVGNVMKAIESLVDISLANAPAWLGPPTALAVDPAWCTTFENRLVEARPDGVMVLNHPGSRWFDPAGMQVEWQQDAECPTWMAAIDQWGSGNPRWAELLQRMLGYCMIGYRECSRLFLWYGVVRGGKGVICRVMRRMMDKGWMSTNLEGLSRQFGLWGLEGAKVLCVDEVNELDQRGGETTVQIAKCLVGQSPITVDRKYQRPLQGVTFAAVPLLVGNEVPTLPDKGKGFTSKMVVLPFHNSWLGHEDYGLPARLELELPGITRWAMVGACKVRRAVEANENPFPPVEGSATVASLIEERVRPLAAFVEDYFEPKRGYFTPSSELWACWEAWDGSSEVRGVNRYNLARRVVEETGGSLELYKKKCRGIQLRGIMGLKRLGVTVDEGYGDSDG